MEMKKILSLSGKLQKILDDAEAEAANIILEAQRKAEKIINDAKAEAETRRLQAQRRTGLEEFMKDAEDEAKKEAKKVEKDYAKRVKDIKNVSQDKIKEATEMVVQEALPQ